MPYWVAISTLQRRNVTTVCLEKKRNIDLLMHKSYINKIQIIVTNSLRLPWLRTKAVRI